MKNNIIQDIIKIYVNKIKYINKILHTESVAIHFRNYTSNSLDTNNLDNNYYNKAISYINSKIQIRNFIYYSHKVAVPRFQMM